jgi:hypothetical protein
LAAKTKAAEEAAAREMAAKVKADEKQAAKLLQRGEAVTLFLFMQKLGIHEVDLINRVRNMLSQTCLKCDVTKLCVDFRQTEIWCMACARKGGAAVTRMRKELSDLERTPVDNVRRVLDRLC